MVMTDTLNAKAKRQYEMMQSGQLSPKGIDLVLRTALLDEDEAFSPKTAGVKIPDWLRSRLIRWAEERGYPTKPFKGVVLMALFDLTKVFGDGKEDAEAVRAAQAGPEARSPRVVHRQEVDGGSAGATALQGAEVQADEGERQSAVAESEG